MWTKMAFPHAREQYLDGLMEISKNTTVLPTKSDSDAVFCLQLLSKALTCSPHLS